MEWKLLIILVLFVPFVYGVEIHYSEDNLTWVNITNVDEANSKGYQINLKPSTLYYFRSRNESSEWSYTSQRTKMDGETVMAGLAITVFILGITIALFWLSAKKGLLDNKYSDFIVRRCFMVLGIFLMILNSAIMASIASNAGLELTDEMLFFVRMFSLAGYPAMVFLVLGTLIQLLKEWKMDKNKKRMGGDYE